jgi:hypothetical protein
LFLRRVYCLFWKNSLISTPYFRKCSQVFFWNKCSFLFWKCSQTIQEAWDYFGNLTRIFWKFSKTCSNFLEMFPDFFWKRFLWSLKNMFVYFINVPYFLTIRCLFILRLFSICSGNAACVPAPFPSAFAVLTMFPLSSPPSLCFCLL